MWIKRKELEQLVNALRHETLNPSAESLTEVLQALVLGNRLLFHPDPADVIPVHDYPFTLPETEDPNT